MKSDEVKTVDDLHLLTWSVETEVASSRLSPPTEMWTGEARSLSTWRVRMSNKSTSGSQWCSIFRFHFIERSCCSQDSQESADILVSNNNGSISCHSLSQWVIQAIKPKVENVRINIINSDLAENDADGRRLIAFGSFIVLSYQSRTSLP